MMGGLPAHNLLAWGAQSIVLASAAVLVTALLRGRHPRAQLLQCQIALAACLAAPLVLPRVHPTVYAPAPALPNAAPAPGSATGSPPAAAATAAKSDAPVAPAPRSAPLRLPDPPHWPPLLWIFAGGALVRLGWTFMGLWRVRRYRIAATPLYPIPESIQAASAITHADALFCVSAEVPGPVMLGWLAPVVLAPESFTALDDEAQCGIACHELLHVKRGDWLVTLLEEAAGAALWFNPAAWLLLAQIRLIREQLVDGEVVRLIGGRDAYVDALLAIARGGRTLDLAPAPLFLRRRHLTHRIRSLLAEDSMSKPRLFSLSFSMASSLVLAGWVATTCFPLAGRPTVIEEAAPAAQAVAVVKPDAAAPAAPAREAGRQAKPEPVIVAFQVPQTRGFLSPSAPDGTGSSLPIPSNPRELVSSGAHPLSEPAARADALGLLLRARENSLTHRDGTPPYRFEVNFTAAPTALYGGTGQLTETWLSGQQWRWTGSLGGYSVVRSLQFGAVTGEKAPGAIPMRTHVLRNAIFWAVARNLPQQIRAAEVQWNGKPVRCLLFSGIAGTTEPGRTWEEEEFCIDPATATIQVHSIAPGTYTVYSYGQGAQFHGRPIPDRIVIYSNGELVTDAQMSLADAGPVDPSQLGPTLEMIARGPVTGTEMPARFPMNVPRPGLSGAARPVIVHASVNGLGQVVEMEVSAASDPSLSQEALDIVKNAHLTPSGSQRQMYVNVRFLPQGQSR